MRARTKLLTATIIALAIAVLAVPGGPALRPLIYQLAMPTDYFEPERQKPDSFDTISPKVFAFRHGFNRSLVVDTGDRIAVFDSFNAGHARALRAILEQRFPGKPVGWVFYSHHHLDHVRGAGELAPGNIVAHHDVMSYVTDFDYADDIVPVTMPVSGDQDLQLGTVRVRMLYLPRSHSETLYAFHLPDERVLFLPDLMFKDAVPPFGFPDWYYPGYIRALDRLLELDADHYVPSHFDIGTRDDLLAYRNMMVDFREAVVEELARYDHDAADGGRLREIMRAVYPELAKKHGHRTGFEAMFIPHFGGQAGGTYLGF